MAFRKDLRWFRTLSARAEQWLRDTDAIGSGAVTSSTVLDTWETELQVAGLVSPSTSCSAHYFDERDGIVAIAWYQQGIRFLDVNDPRDNTQVGYIMIPSTYAFSVEWIGEGADGSEILYTLDPARGIDILRFDRSSSALVRAPIVPTAPVPGVVPHSEWGYACAIPV